MTKIVIKGHGNLSKNDFSHLFDMADWGGFVSYVAGVTEWDIFFFFGEDDDSKKTYVILAALACHTRQRRG